MMLYQELMAAAKKAIKTYATPQADYEAGAPFRALALPKTVLELLAAHAALEAENAALREKLAAAENEAKVAWDTANEYQKMAEKACAEKTAAEARTVLTVAGTAPGERGHLCCPFCGSDDVSHGEVSTTIAGTTDVTQSECQSCGALGPWAVLSKGEVDYGDVKSVAAWNARAVLAASAAPAAQEDAKLLKAVGAVIKAKGRFHTEQNYIALVAAYDAAIAANTPK